MSEVIPIRPGVAGARSVADELVDYAAEAIKTFAEHDEPVALGIVIIGRKKAFPGGYVLVEGKTLAEVLSYSGALLFNRATQAE